MIRSISIISSQEVTAWPCQHSLCSSNADRRIKILERPSHERSEFVLCDHQTITSIKEFVGDEYAPMEKTEEIAFLNEIKANPENRTLKGAFADWLDERGRSIEATEYREGSDWHRYNDSETWTLYVINETIYIRWYGTSNGYYSESVNFAWLNQEDN